MKKGTCLKCHGTRVGRLGAVRDRGHYDNPAPRMIGGIVEPGLLKDGFEFHGRIEAYVCTECGYFEEYVREAPKVPWESLTDFEWVEAPKPPPFR